MRALSILCGLAFLAACWAGEAPDAAALLTRVRANRPALSLQLDATLKVERRLAEVYDLQMFLNGNPKNARSVYRVTAPDEAAGSSLLIVEGGELWLQEKGSSAPRKLEAADLPKPFLGSDFSYEDLEFAFLRWPNPRFVKESRRLGFDCWVIESMPPADEPSQYGRVLSWVDKNYISVVIAEAYDKKNKLLKTLSVQSVRKLDDKGHYIPGQITLENAQTKGRTVLRVDTDRPMPNTPALFEPATFSREPAPVPLTPDKK